MKNIKNIIIILFLLCATVSVVIAASVKITPITTAIITTDESIVEKAIINACSKQNWHVIERKEGEITAELNVRSHRLVISIVYNEDGYTIYYKDSENLNYDEKKQTIHGKYRTWINNLRKQITANIE